MSGGLTNGEHYTVSHHIPELAFGRRHCGSKLAGAVDLRGGDLLVFDDAFFGHVDLTPPPARPLPRGEGS